MSQSIQWVECPRDAMQGIKHFIPTEQKVEYLKSLLQCGFHSLDAGSFVSAKAIPQLVDTDTVFEQIKDHLGKTRLLAIIANIKGAERASSYGEKLSYIGYPLSLSETFQQRNTNRSIDQAFVDLKEIHSIAQHAGQELVVYLSMGFGNPYGDVYNTSYLSSFTSRLVDLGVNIVSLSDTVAVAKPMQVEQSFSALKKEFDSITLGAHLHVRPGTESSLIEAALNGGCNRFDTAMKGYGGCPMATDDLAGNLASEVLLQYLENGKYNHNININAFLEAERKAQALFSIYE